MLEPVRGHSGRSGGSAERGGVWPCRSGVVAVALSVAIFGSGCASLPFFGREAPPKLPYTATFARTPITVDGNLDEASWQSAEPITRFMVPVTYAAPISTTEARVLWDRDYLYIGFKAADKDVWGVFTERDDTTCREDVLEVFIRPDPAQLPYYNFEINTLGACLDMYHVLPRAGMSRRWKLWDCQGLKIATTVNGTLNNWEDEDIGWQLEVAIPFADLPSLRGQHPRAGDEWLFHLSRYDYSVFLPEGPELTSCAPLSELNYHLYEDWVPLRFVTGE